MFTILAVFDAQHNLYENPQELVMRFHRYRFEKLKSVWSGNSKALNYF